MNDVRFRRILKAALASAVATPAFVAAACGGSVEGVSSSSSSGGSSGSTPTGTTTGTPTKGPPPPVPDASTTVDAGQCGNADLPSENLCQKYIQLPCGVSEDAGTFTQEECKKMCPSGGDSGVA